MLSRKMNTSNRYLKSLWNYLIRFHTTEELEQINNCLSVSLALSKLNCNEENGSFIYKCTGCSKFYPTVPDIIKHLHIVHSSELFEICEIDEEVIDLTLDENTQ